MLAAFECHPNGSGAKRNVAEKEGGVAVNVGKDDTTGNERFPLPEVTYSSDVKLGLVKSPQTRWAL